LEQAVAAQSKPQKQVTALAVTPDGAVRTLRQALTESLAERLKLPVEDLQITFKPADEAILRRAEPQDTFLINPQRSGNLGDVSWGVTISGQTRTFITGHARAWRTQVTANHSIQSRQVISAEDVTEKRMLVDTLTPDPLLALNQVVGQAATRDFGVGAVFSGRMVEPAVLVKLGQDVMIDSTSGGVRLLTAAKALSDGSLGQSVRLRNEQTRQVFNGVVTGPRRVSLAGAALPGSVR
jgi:flagella basal body P-ring formation protein FlgA